MIDNVIVFAMIFAAILALVWLWSSERRRSRFLDRWGAEYGIKRWNGETNDSFQNRINERIAIKGGRNRWR